MASIYTVLFIACIFGIAWGINQIMFYIANILGWFEQPLKKNRWYDKYTARFSQWVFEKAEIYKIDF